MVWGAWSLLGELVESSKHCLRYSIRHSARNFQNYRLRVIAVSTSAETGHGGLVFRSREHRKHVVPANRLADGDTANVVKPIDGAVAVRTYPSGEVHSARGGLAKSARLLWQFFRDHRPVCRQLRNGLGDCLKSHPPLRLRRGFPCSAPRW